MSKTKQRKSKAGKSIAIFFIVLIVLEGLIIFGLKTIFKTEDSTPSFGGYYFFLMDSDNMSPTVPKNTLVISTKGKPDESKISCAVLCQNVGEEGTTIAWLTEIGSKGDTVNGIVYTVYQDNVSGADNGARFYDVESDNVLGVAASHYITAGKIVSFVITPFGMAICLAVPLVMLVLLELVVAVTNRSDDESYDDDYANAQQQFYNNGAGGQRGQRGQNGNVSLDDFLYGGNGDEVYGGGKPNADYSEEFDDRRSARPQQPGRMQQNMQAVQNNMRGRPDFSVNEERDDGFDPFGEDEDNGFESFEGNGAPASETFGGFEQQPQDDSAFYHPGDEAVAETFEDEEDDSVFFDAPSPAPAPAPASAPAPVPMQQQPSVDREYYERASKLIEGDDYQPAPAPAPVQQPRPVMQQTAAPVQPQPTVALEKPRAQAPAPAAAPAPARRPAQPMAPTPRRRPAQPPQGAPRRRPAGSPPPRQGAGQRRPRPAQPRPGQQPRRAPHKDANAALADLVKKMNEEQQKMGNKPE